MFDGGLGFRGGVTLGAAAKRAQVAVRVDAGPVPVEPLEPDGVVADDLQILQLLLDGGALEEANGPRVPRQPAHGQ